MRLPLWFRSGVSDVTTRAVKRLAERGEIPVVRIGRLSKCRLSLLHDWNTKKLLSNALRMWRADPQ